MDNTIYFIIAIFVLFAREISCCGDNCIAGGMITSTASDNGQGINMHTYYLWETNINHNCTADNIDQEMSNLVWVFHFYFANIGNNITLQIKCKDFNTEDKWSLGYSETVFNTTDTLLSGLGRYQSARRQWKYLTHGGGSFFVFPTANTTIRTDTGSVNNSPTPVLVPVVKFRYGCLNTHLVEVTDLDGDVVRCRLAIDNNTYNYNECSSVCGSLAGIVISMETCVLSYNGTEAGTFAVALQIEDFIDNTTTTPLSSVPMQFIVTVTDDGQQCENKYTTPSAYTGDVKVIEMTSTFNSSLPQGTNLDVTETFVDISGEFKATLIEFYQKYADLDVRIQDIRTGSIIVVYAIVFENNSEVFQKILLAIGQLMEGTIMVYRNQSVPVTSKVSGLCSTLCCLYISILGECREDQRCVEENSTAFCRELKTGDDFQRSIIIIPSLSFALLCVVTYIICICVMRKRQEREKEKKRIRNSRGYMTYLGHQHQHHQGESTRSRGNMTDIGSQHSHHLRESACSLGNMTDMGNQHQHYIEESACSRENMTADIGNQYPHLTDKGNQHSHHPGKLARIRGNLTDKGNQHSHYLGESARSRRNMTDICNEHSHYPGKSAHNRGNMTDIGNQHSHYPGKSAHSPGNMTDKGNQHPQNLGDSAALARGSDEYI